MGVSVETGKRRALLSRNGPFSPNHTPCQRLLLTSSNRCRASDSFISGVASTRLVDMMFESNVSGAAVSCGWAVMGGP